MATKLLSPEMPWSLAGHPSLVTAPGSVPA